jgi:uncharacterized RDD family membrane protein YckC
MRDPALRSQRAIPNAIAAAPARDPPPGLLRRLAALVYDLLLLLAVLAAATVCWLPFTGGQAVTPDHAGYRLFLLGLSFWFYGWFWTHGGQTLGMRAWRMRIYAVDGRPIGWGRAVRRFAAAAVSAVALGLGFLWPALSDQRKAWHDLLSGTFVDWE